jgi:hypothetical protein
MRLPRVISPQMHRQIDLVALPSVIASVVWMSRRNTRVAALMSMIAAREGAALLITDYPPGFLCWMSFRDHIWAATLYGILAASLGCWCRISRCGIGVFCSHLLRCRSF